MNDFQNIPNPGRPRDEAMFSNDWIRVVAVCQGIAGARVSQRYDWEANRGRVWSLQEVKILPDPEDPRWQITLDTSRG